MKRYTTTVQIDIDVLKGAGEFKVMIENLIREALKKYFTEEVKISTKIEEIK